MECDICGGDARPNPETGGYLSASHPGWYLEILCSPACAKRSIRHAAERAAEKPRSLAGHTVDQAPGSRTAVKITIAEHDLKQLQTVADEFRSAARQLLERPLRGAGRMSDH